VGAGAVFTVLLVALHVVKPEIDPSCRFISAYAIGTHGWMMVLAFFSLALGQVALFLALRPQIATFGGRIGLVSLLVGAAGLGLAGAFTSDPITSSAPATTSGELRGRFGPDVPVGWSTRFEIVTYDLWLMVVAWCAIRVSGGSAAEARG
jgi:hypothetical protein